MLGFRSFKKIIAVIILTFSSVFIDALFLNYLFELMAVREQIGSNPVVLELYNAQVTMSLIVSLIAGGVIFSVALVVLFFSINQIIKEQSSELGVLKAMGYSRTRLAANFMIFGLAIFGAAIIAYLGAWALSPIFYSSFHDATFLPDISFGFQIVPILILILGPTILFMISGFLYAVLKLRHSPLALIKGVRKSKVNRLTTKLQNKQNSLSFLPALKKNMLWNNLALIFFMGFAGFSFGTQFQMSFTMTQLTVDILMIVTILIFGLIMGLVTLFLALSFITNSNSKYLAIMKAYGYTNEECSKALFGGYRLITYIGFAVGTVYQYVLTVIMGEIFRSSYPDTIGSIDFHRIGFMVSLGGLLLAYESFLLFFKRKIGRTSLRKIMQEI